MKKFAFTIFAATLAFGANADVEPANAANCCVYDGLFFGLGVSAVDSGVKTETTDVYGANDAAEFSNSADDYTHGRIGNYDTTATGCLGTFTGDIGIDTNDHDTRFTGNAVLGYGKRIQEKAYVAIEAGLDAGQNSNFCHVGMSPEGGKKFDVFSKNNGLIPSAALRLGYIHPETKTMVYLKAGAAYSQAKTTYVDNYFAGYGDQTVDANPSANPQVYADADAHYETLPYSGKCSKWTPIVALGFEKVTGKNFRTRAEVEYRFQTTKSFDFNNEGTTYKAWINTDHSNESNLKGITAAQYNGTVKIYNKAAITLRVMGIYTVK